MMVRSGHNAHVIANTSTIRPDDDRESRAERKAPQATLQHLCRLELAEIVLTESEIQLGAQLIEEAAPCEPEETGEQKRYQRYPKAKPEEGRANRVQIVWRRETLRGASVKWVAVRSSRITSRCTYLAGQGHQIPTRANIPHAGKLRRLCPLANHSNEEFAF